MRLLQLKLKEKMINKKTHPKDYKTEIKILAKPGLAYNQTLNNPAQGFLMLHLCLTDFFIPGEEDQLWFSGLHNWYQFYLEQSKMTIEKNFKFSYNTEVSITCGS